MKKILATIRMEITEAAILELGEEGETLESWEAELRMTGETMLEEAPKGMKLALTVEVVEDSMNTPTENEPSPFKQYRRKGLSEMRPYVPGEVLDGVSISQEDLAAGSPKEGDMVARNPDNHADQWLVAKAYFEKNLTLA